MTISQAAVAVALAGGLWLAAGTEPDLLKPRTVLDLQPGREAASAGIRTRAGREGTARLINLNPAVNSWFVLEILWKDGARSSWHIENPRPRETRLLLDGKVSGAIAIVEGRDRFDCDLFNPDSENSLDRGARSQWTYYPLCKSKLYLRNPLKGSRSALETATEFLRDQVWGGEKVIVLFHHLLGERYRETGEIRPGDGSDAGTAANGPAAAQIDGQFSNQRISAPNLGIGLAAGDGRNPDLKAGAWYAAAGSSGVFVSVIQPGQISANILRADRGLANDLDGVERASLCYLIAFDLHQYEAGYELGTEHPQVGWSARVPPAMRDARLPGPDGIGSIQPLIATGLIRPDYGRRTVAAFTSGFKRTHGAFRYGELALRNHGSHYGFIEQGVVLSQLQPGLATLYVMDDGSVDMKTWASADNALLGRIRHARQNGAPLVEFDEAMKRALPGRLVAKWGPGNWSGSEDEKLRTIRGGVAVQKNGARRFLIYAVFSDATPSAMARVFQAYGCSYGMLLDMNALEHTYLALYRRNGKELIVDHLMKGMSVLDKSFNGSVVPRFLGFPDNRDFFYVMRRGETGGTE